MSIKVLSPLVTNQIAAGEVVERPASVIKELVENSLDAGATRIEIEIAQGGCSLIRIRDNGCGIPKDELALALTRHATSKIVDVEDLSSITSFGFRGEALASVAAVSRLTLVSKPRDQSEAWQIHAEGIFEQPQIMPASHPDGTMIMVKDLFFNVPARRRFLKSERTESAHVANLFKTFALGNYAVSFILISNGKTLYNLPPAVDENQRTQRLSALLGSAFAQKRIAVSFDRSGLKLTGFVLPAASEESSEPEAQYLFLNGRPIREKNTLHAIRQAYSEVYGRDAKASYILFLDMNPADVDVNVQPTKHEVRFADQRLVHDFFVLAVRQALSQVSGGESSAAGDFGADGELAFGDESPSCDVAAEDSATSDSGGRPAGASSFVSGGGFGSGGSSFSSGGGSGRFGGSYSGGAGGYASGGGGYASGGGGYAGPRGSSAGASERAASAYTSWMSGVTGAGTAGRESGNGEVHDGIRPLPALYGFEDGTVCFGFEKKLYTARLADLDEALLNAVYTPDTMPATLMIPQQIKLEDRKQQEAVSRYSDLVRELAFSCQLKGQSMKILAVPECLRRYDIAALARLLAQKLAEDCADAAVLRQALAGCACAGRSYGIADAVNILYDAHLDLPSLSDKLHAVDVACLIRGRHGL